MFKVIMLVVGLGVGFGGGVYWGVHHPTQANHLSATEERKFLETQSKLTETLKAGLAQIHGQHPASVANATTPGSSSVSADIQDLDKKADLQLKELHDRLNQLGQ